MITIQVWNASFCRILKNPDHWDLIWEILSYKDFYKTKTGDNRTSKLSFFSKQGGKFGFGLLPYVVEQLKKKEEKYKIIYNRQPILMECKTNLNLGKIILEDYQQEIINTINSKTFRGIIGSPTGSGKGILMAATIDKFNRPETLIFVPNKTILYGVHKEISETLNEDVGLIGDNIFQKKNITVGLYQSLRSHPKEFFKTKLALIDEAHGVNDSIINTLNTMTMTWYRYGFTGTPIPKTKKKKWFQNTSQIGEVIKRISDKQAIKRVVPVEAYMFTFIKTTKFDDFQKIYRDLLLDEDRCELIVEMINFCLNDHKRKNCLVLVDEYKQAQKIKEIADKFFESSIPLCWAKTPMNEKFKIIDDLNKSKIPITIATPVFGVGTNIKGVDSLVSGAIRKASHNIIQKIGRGRRRINDKEFLLYTDIYDKIYTEENNLARITNISEKRKNLYKIKKWLKKIY